jgi:hypothetical protein
MEMELGKNYQQCNQCAGCSMDDLYLLHQFELEKWNNWGQEWRKRHIVCMTHQEKEELHGMEGEGVGLSVVKEGCHRLELEQYSGLWQEQWQSKSLDLYRQFVREVLHTWQG